MTAQEIWKNFCEKLENDALTEADCTEEIGPYLIPFLRGPQTQESRTAYISAVPRYYDMDHRAVVSLECSPGNNFRFDFVQENGGYKLAFMECVTLPLDDITALPYADFKPLPKFENHIRRELEITNLVRYYSKFKELLGREDAVRIFTDGKGKSVAARSWVPFYDNRLAYIAFTAWWESRINGETVVLEEFTTARSVLRFRECIWLRMYRITGHLRTQIPYDEYLGLFEAIWRDRAEKSGWTVGFTYEGEDLTMTFMKAAEQDK